MTFEGNSADGFLGKTFFPDNREVYLPLPFLLWFLLCEAWHLKQMHPSWDSENYTNAKPSSSQITFPESLKPRLYYYLVTKCPYWLATVTWVLSLSSSYSWCTNSHMCENVFIFIPEWILLDIEFFFDRIFSSAFSLQFSSFYRCSEVSYHQIIIFHR